MTKWPDRKSTIFQNFQTLLTSSWERFRRKIPGKKRKNSARCARQQGQERRKKQEEKFFDSRIVGPKAAEQCFFTKFASKTRRAERAEIFGILFVRAKRARHQKPSPNDQIENQKVVAIRPLSEKNTARKCLIFQIVSSKTMTWKRQYISANLFLGE